MASLNRRKGGNKPSLTDFSFVSALVGEAKAGIAMACIIAPTSLAAGVLVFSAAGLEYAAIGAIAGLACALFAGFAAALCKQDAFIVTAPSTTGSLVLASLVAAVMVASNGNVGLALLAAMVCVLLTGLWQIAFACMGLGRIIRYAPHPVVAGFVTGVALSLITTEAILMSGMDSLQAMAGALANWRWPQPEETLFGLSLLALMLVAQCRPLRFLPVPLLGLLVGVLLHHLGMMFWPSWSNWGTVGELPPFGSWLTVTIVSPAMTLQPSRLLHSDMLLLLVTTSLTIALYGFLDTMIGAKVAQEHSNFILRPKRDLAGLGVGNLVAAVAGGLPLSSSQSTVLPALQAGGRSRLTPLFACLTLLFLIWLAPELLESLPLVSLNAILIFMGIRNIDRRIFNGVRRLSTVSAPARQRARRNALVFSAVMVVTLFQYPAVGALLGIILAGALFIIDMSRPVVVARRHGDALFSRRVRSADDQSLLRQHGHRTVILRLEGVVFFGNADDLAVELRQGLNEADHVVLDCRRVGDLDDSAAATLEACAARYASHGKRLVLAGVVPALEEITGEIESARRFADLDAALEWCEAQILDALSLPNAERRPLTLARTDLAEGLEAAEIATLAAYLEPISHLDDTPLCYEGEAAEGLWVLTSGSASVRLGANSSGQRIAGIAAGAMVGEMALMEERSRSATIVSDEEISGYWLGRTSFEAIGQAHPHIARKLVFNIARVSVRRLRITTDALRYSEAN